MKYCWATKICTNTVQLFSPLCHLYGRFSRHLCVKVMYDFLPHKFLRAYDHAQTRNRKMEQWNEKQSNSCFILGIFLVTYQDMILTQPKEGMQQSGLLCLSTPTLPTLTPTPNLQSHINRILSNFCLPYYLHITCYWAPGYLMTRQWDKYRALDYQV